MNDKIWTDLHKTYSQQEWIDKPSIFAEQAIRYFPKTGDLLELGAGQAQDSCYFAANGYDVTATDINDTALELAAKKAEDKAVKITVNKVDLRDKLPFKDKSFDIVYAHLSLHYFDYETTMRLFKEIQRILKSGGVFAFLTNSINDPEYKTGEKLENDFFKIGATTKRYFSEDSTRKFAQYLKVCLLDELGETYKDNDKGVHKLVRYVGKKPSDSERYTLAIPYVGAIIERNHKGVKELLLQTRWNSYDPLYCGTLEFPAGVLDKPYENVYDALAREINEECGLVLKKVIGDSRTKIYSPKNSDAIFAFRPFCCTQQLKDGHPWFGCVFICEVEDGGSLAPQLSETKDPKWVPASEVKDIYLNTPEKLFGLELPAWEYYFSQ